MLIRGPSNWYDDIDLSDFDKKKNKVRKYYPDFIIDEFLIIEAKWIGFIYERDKEQILSKKDELEKFCEQNGFSSLFVTNNLVKKKFIEQAKRIHNEKYSSKK